MLSQIESTIKILLFYKYRNIKKFVKRFFYSKRNDLMGIKDILELFYDDTIEIKPNKEDQEKDLKKRKVVANTASASKLYDKLLYIYIYIYIYI